MSAAIHLLSGPRNISTAMMYSFAQRNDCTVVDEPLYAHYLHCTGLQHPGRNEVLAAQEHDGKKVIQNVLLASFSTPLVFFKQMTHHLIHLDFSFLQSSKNILLIRDPKKVLYSYSKVIKNPSLSSIGIQESYHLYKYLSDNNFHFCVVDADRFLQNPEKGLKQICASCGIQFQPAMLHWQAGARKEDGVWAKYWYANVHKSTGFEKPVASEILLPEELLPVYAEAKKYYEELLNVTEV